MFKSSCQNHCMAAQITDNLTFQQKKALFLCQWNCETDISSAQIYWLQFSQSALVLQGKITTLLGRECCWLLLLSSLYFWLFGLPVLFFLMPSFWVFPLITSVLWYNHHNLSPEKASALQRASRRKASEVDTEHSCIIAQLPPTSAISWLCWSVFCCLSQCLLSSLNALST